MLPSQAAVEQNARFSAQSPRRDFGGWLRPLVLVLLFAGGTVLRFLFLTRKAFWFDECFSVVVARLDWPNFLHVLWWREANMSLYYLLLRGWSHFGQSEFFIRSLSVIAAVATLPAIYWLARVLFDRRVALITVAMLSFNAYHIRYAQEARSYAFFVLLGTLSSGFLVACLRTPSASNRLGYVLTSILAVYAHLYALLLVASNWLALRLLDRGSAPDGTNRNDRNSSPARPPHMRRAWVWIGVSTLPLLIFVGKTGAGPLRWIQRPGFIDLLDYYKNLAGSDGLLLLGLYVVACFGAVAPVRKKLFMRATDWNTWRVQFLLIWLLFPVILTALLSLARPLFLARYLAFCLPSFIILTAAGLARLRKLWQLTAALAAMLLLSLQGTLWYYDHDLDLEHDGSGAASNYVLDHAQPGDAVLFHIAEARVPYEFFRSVRTGGRSAEQHSPAPLEPEIVFPRHGDRLDYRDFTGKPSSELLRSLGGRYGRVWVVLMYNGPPANPDPTTLMLTRILGESFARSQQWEFPKVQVRLYSR